MAGPGLRASWPAEAAMDAEELEVFLDAHRYCVLGDRLEQGGDRSRGPVAFLVLGSSVWAGDCRWQPAAQPSSYSLGVDRYIRGGCWGSSSGCDRWAGDDNDRRTPVGEDDAWGGATRI